MALLDPIPRARWARHATSSLALAVALAMAAASGCDHLRTGPSPEPACPQAPAAGGGPAWKWD
jgi:hypothetical protein